MFKHHHQQQQKQQREKTFLCRQYEQKFLTSTILNKGIGAQNL